MTIVSCILARNEADRDLPAVLENAATFADRILVLDDADLTICRTDAIMFHATHPRFERFLDKCLLVQGQRPWTP